MWPAERLVLNRIIRVSGRIIWLNNSINGRRIAKNMGAPKGSKWATNDFSWVDRITNIKDTHNTRDKDILKK